MCYFGVLESGKNSQIQKKKSQEVDLGEGDDEGEGEEYAAAFLKMIRGKKDEVHFLFIHSFFLFFFFFLPFFLTNYFLERKRGG